MKKLLIIVVIYCITIFNLTAQIRENKVIGTFDSESQKLTEATGWAQSSETGKWIENKNVISEEPCPSFWISHVSQNFKWIQFKTLYHNEKKFYIFVYESLRGEYKYPNIREDWEAYLRTYFFILTAEQYGEIKTKIDFKSGENIEISSKMTGYITNNYKILNGEYLYNEENLLLKITMTIEKPRYSESCLVINSQTTDGVDVVRFRLPEGCYYAGKLMKTAYFEVKISDFKTLLSE